MELRSSSSQSRRKRTFLKEPRTKQMVMRMIKIKRKRTLMNMMDTLMNKGISWLMQKGK